MALSFDPIRFNTPGSNATAYGNAVDLGRIWRANRGASFSPSNYIAQKIANDSAVETAASNADTYAMGKSLGAIGTVSSANKIGNEIKDQARDSANKSTLSSGLGALAGIGGTLLSGGNPLVGAVASKGGQLLGNLFG